MPHHPLRAAAASYAIGLTSTEILVEAAHEMLNRGVYSYSLGELAKFLNPTWRDVLPLFLATLEELEIAIPKGSEALNLFFRAQISKLAEERESVANTFHSFRKFFFSHAR